jgi:hypothetical protein
MQAKLQANIAEVQCEVRLSLIKVRAGIKVFLKAQVQVQVQLQVQCVS